MVVLAKRSLMLFVFAVGLGAQVYMVVRIALCSPVAGAPGSLTRAPMVPTSWRAPPQTPATLGEPASGGQAALHSENVRSQDVRGELAAFDPLTLQVSGWATVVDDASPLRVDFVLDDGPVVESLVADRWPGTSFDSRLSASALAVPGAHKLSAWAASHELRGSPVHYEVPQGEYPVVQPPDECAMASNGVPSVQMMVHRQTHCVAEVRAACPQGIFVVVLTVPHQSGGPEVLHTLHSALNRQGLCSLMAGAVAFYQDEWTRALPIGHMGQMPLDSDLEGLLTGADTVIFPEGAVPGESIMRVVDEAGARKMVFFLGQVQPSLKPWKNQGWIPLCDTRYLGLLYGCPQQAVLFPPISPHFYESARLAAELPRARTNLILFDNDFPVDLGRLTKPTNDTEFAILKDLSFDELVDVYTRAKVFVDWYVPGPERAIYESVLHGVVPVVGRNGNARLPSDLDIPPELLVDFDDYDALDAAMKRALLSYDELAPRFDTMRDAIRVQPAEFEDAVAGYFQADVCFYVAALSQHDMEDVLPWMLAALLQFPFASFEIVVGDAYFFNFQSSAVIERLEACGLWSQVTIVQATPAERRSGAGLILTRRPTSRRRSFLALFWNAGGLHGAVPQGAAFARVLEGQSSVRLSESVMLVLADEAELHSPTRDYATTLKELRDELECPPTSRVDAAIGGFDTAALAALAADPLWQMLAPILDVVAGIVSRGGDADHTHIGGKSARSRSHSMSALAAGACEPPAPFLVYIYDLPSRWNSDLAVASPGGACESDIFRTELMVPRLLRDSAFVTDDPKKANLFYVPWFSTCFAEKRRPELNACGLERRDCEAHRIFAETGRETDKVVAWLHDFGPYLERARGRDHVWMFNFDVGPARYMQGMGKDTQKLVQNGIHVGYFGVSQESEIFGSQTFNTWKDVVIPSPLWNPHFVGQTPVDADAPVTGDEFRRRSRLATFRGGIADVEFCPLNRDCQVYGYGIRPRLRDMFKGNPDIYFVDRNERLDGHTRDDPTFDSYYIEEMRNSKFVLAAPGFSPWSPRYYEAISCGAVPVSLHGDVEWPYERFIDYTAFGLQFGVEDFFKIESTLRAVDETTWVRMANQLPVVAHALKWNDPPHKCDAFHFLLKELSSKVRQMRHAGPGSYGPGL